LERRGWSWLVLPAGGPVNAGQGGHARIVTRRMNILVVNAGSSSLKLRLIDDDDQVVSSADLAQAEADRIGGVLGEFLRSAPPVAAVGHRVVHGGHRFVEPVLLDRSSEAMLEHLVELAPLHNPPSVAAILALQRLRADLPQVACFDTAFHATLPPAAATYALPASWRSRWDLRRFGFHGLSHAWASRRAAELLNRPVAQLRLVTAHIGAGASLAAVASGSSVDTTMGFTPLEGLVMATRPGNVDPGLLLFLLRHGVGPEEVETALERASGLLGLSGLSGDLREVLAAADAGHQDAGLAYAVYVHRLQTSTAAMAAAMGGVDALVYTGGAGTASPRLRSDVCSKLAFLGVTLDEERNGACRADGVVSPPGAGVHVAVVESREDLEIVGHVRALVS
jgi:acetate kinase